MTLVGSVPRGYQVSQSIVVLLPILVFKIIWPKNQFKETSDNIHYHLPTHAWKKQTQAEDFICLYIKCNRIVR